MTIVYFKAQIGSIIGSLIGSIIGSNQNETKNREMYFVQSLKRLMKRTSKYLLLKLAQSTNLFVFRPRNQTIPPSLPLIGQKSVFQVVCVVAVYLENAKNEETVDFNKSP